MKNIHLILRSHFLAKGEALKGTHQMPKLFPICFKYVWLTTVQNNPLCSFWVEEITKNNP